MQRVYTAWEKGSGKGTGRTEAAAIAHATEQVPIYRLYTGSIQALCWLSVCSVPAPYQLCIVADVRNGVHT